MKSKKQKDIFKIRFMKDAHLLAKTLCKHNDNSYRDNLNLAMKVRHLKKEGGKSWDDKKFLNVIDISWVKNNFPGIMVKLSNMQDLKKDSIYTISFNEYSDKNNIEIEQYLSVDQSYMNSIVSQPRTGQRYLD